MTFRKAMTLAVILLIGSVALDIWWVRSGRLWTTSHVPGMYEIACILVMGGLVAVRNRDRRESLAITNEEMVKDRPGLGQ